MRTSLIRFCAFSLSTLTSAAAYAATSCENLTTIPLDHAVITDARLVREGPGDVPPLLSSTPV